MGNRMRAALAYVGVECYVGMPGSGKTYALVERGVEALRRGQRVFTNAGFAIVDHELDCPQRKLEDGNEQDCKCPRRSETYYSLEELLTVPNGAMILLDEAPVFVNSRKGDEFPPGMTYRMTQVRKDGIQFIYSAMDEMMVDKNFRRVTFVTWHCRRWMFGIFKRTAMPPIDRRLPDDSPQARKWLFGLRRDVAQAYDTYSKVYIPPQVLDTLIVDQVRPWLPLTNEVVEAIWAGRESLRRRGERESLALVDKFVAEARERLRQDGVMVPMERRREGPRPKAGPQRRPRVAIENAVRELQSAKP